MSPMHTAIVPRLTFPWAYCRRPSTVSNLWMVSPHLSQQSQLSQGSLKRGGNGGRLLSELPCSAPGWSPRESSIGI